MSKINKKIIFFLLCGLFSASYETYCDQMNGDNGKSPSDENSCALLSGPNVHDDICCFYTLVDTSLSSGSNPIPQNICHSIPYSARTNITYDYYNGTLYKGNCSEAQLVSKKKESNVLARCGEDVSNPNQKKCQKYSSYVDSCCYWNGKDLIEGGEPYPSSGRGCYWLGAKFDGKIVWGSMKLKCSSVYQTVSLYMLALYILFSL